MLDGMQVLVTLVESEAAVMQELRETLLFT